jgi:sulfoxide reductase heme-binding subunit YedZ
MLLWYLARGAGITAYLMLSLATGAGAYTARRSPRLEARVLVQYVHRSAALCGVTMLALHIVTLVLDRYAAVGVGGALVPFASGYRPAAVTLGVLSMYVLMAVVVSGVLRSRFASSERGAGVWRRIHLASYGAWALAAWHFLASGTDSSQWWARAVLFAGIAVVAGGVGARLSERKPSTAQPAKNALIGVMR